MEELRNYLDTTPVSILRVLDDEKSFIHTHVLEKFNHKNIEIVIDVEEAYTGQIITYVVGCIMTGIKLADNTIHHIGKYGTVLIKEIEREDDGKMFRLVLPDEKGHFPMDENCSLKYKNQLN
jgi:hypothetical protein